MKVLQLIDSLDAGGAERIAVTFANVLSRKGNNSHLAVTRTEGVLKQNLSSEVGYFYVQKKSSLDLRGLFRLRSYVKTNAITVVHAHTTSYFFATLLKMVYPRLRLIWHTHLGERVETGRMQNWALYVCSYFFSAILTVNEDLRSWCLRKLATKSVYYLPNFVEITPFDNLKATPRDKTIVCLANLKPPKNHLNLLQAFTQISPEFPEWRLLLAGKDFEDLYSEKLKEFIFNSELQNKVVFLGQYEQVAELLSQSSVGVLSSNSEGLPMALLEYGAAGLAVVVTNVGHCKAVVGDRGRIVPADDSRALAQALSVYLSNAETRTKDAARFNSHIRSVYSVEAVLPKLVSIYKALDH